MIKFSETSDGTTSSGTTTRTATGTGDNSGANGQVLLSWRAYALPEVGGGQEHGAEERECLALTQSLPAVLSDRGAAGKGDWTLGRGHRRDQGNAGCAILEKHMPVKGKLVAVGVKYARTEYRVLDGFNYRMPKSEFTSQRRSRSSAVWLQGIKARWGLSPSTYLNNSMKPEISVKSPESRPSRD